MEADIWYFQDTPLHGFLPMMGRYESAERDDIQYKMLKVLFSLSEEETSCAQRENVLGMSQRWRREITVE